LPVHHHNCSLFLARRGSLLAEALISIPLYVLVWCLVMFSSEMMNRSLALEKDARTCTWPVAAGSCELWVPPVDPACIVTRPLGFVDDTRLRGETGGAFKQISSTLPFLASSLTVGLLGSKVRTALEDVVSRPTWAGGEQPLEGAHTMMCNVGRQVPWTVDTTFPQTCLLRGVALWCQ
jgi:hypothetical protein